MKEKILITSLARVNKKTPWRVGIYIDNGYTVLTVGENGTVAMSPRFYTLLNEFESKVLRYPVEISFYHLNQNRDMEVNRLKEKIAYIDCGFSSNKLLDKGKFQYGKEVYGNPLATEDIFTNQDTDNSVQVFNSRAIEDGSDGTGEDAPDPEQDGIGEVIYESNLDYIAIASVTGVEDGDTIFAKILKPSEFLNEKGITVDAEITVRYNGVTSAETGKPDDSNRVAEQTLNTLIAKVYGVKSDEMYDVAREAEDFNKYKLGFKENNLVILNFDRLKRKDPPLKNDNGNYVCDVYITKEKNAEILFEKVKKGDTFIHLNKTMLITKSDSFTHIPLGLLVPNDIYDKTSVLNPYSWATYLNIAPVDLGKIYEDGPLNPDIVIDPVEDYDPDVSDVIDENIDIDSQIEFNPSESLDNSLDFFPPYDDRAKEFVGDIQSIEDLKNHSKVRIGDVILTIPPTSINIDRSTNITKVSTMRTKSSVLVNNGQTATTLSMELYFHDMQSINGKKIPWRNIKDYEPDEGVPYFFVDGLRPLLAQFAKTPFVPIDNYYLNEVLGIADVALMDLQVSTVPNFPQSLVATLTLVEFNADAYLMYQGNLNQSINYPMMRWYYNQSMAERGRQYRTFKGIETPTLSDHLSFTLADETYLKERVDALEYLKNAQSPETLKELLKQDPEYKAREYDASQAEMIVEQYDRFYGMHWLKEHQFIGNFTSPAFSQYIKNKYKLNDEETENALASASEYFNELYDGKYSDVSTIVDAIGKYKESFFIPHQALMELDYRDQSNTGGVSSKVAYGLPDDISNGVIIVEIPKSEQAKSVLNRFDKYKTTRGYYAIPFSDHLLQSMRNITELPDAMEEGIEEKTKEYNRCVNVVDASELGVPMIPYKIAGDFIPTSITAGFTNTFASNHLLGGDAPNLQYMGGGDVYLNISLEIDDEAAADFTRLLKITDDYAKEYRQGIASGFLGINNDLAQLFGVDSIMFEKVQIGTMNGFPGHYQVQITAISFDKTQRQREELKAIPGNTSNMDVEMLKANSYAYANDRMIESRLKNVEIYPDLELPTYKELNAALPHLDAGCIEYKNHTNGRYVDPDFYFSTVGTLRQKIEDIYSDNHTVNMFDGTGVAAYTSSTDMNKVFDTTPENWKKLKAIQDDEDVQPLNWLFSWSESESEDDKAEAPENTEGTEVQSEEVRNWLKEEKDGKLTYKQFPSYEEYVKLYGNIDPRAYSQKANNPNPSEADLYRKLDSFVDKYFAGYYLRKDFIKEWFAGPEDILKYRKKISYSPPEQLYGSVLNIGINKGKIWTYDSQTDEKLLKKLKKQYKEKELDIPEVTDHLSMDDLINGQVWGEDKGIRTTKERLMTLMKAFLDKTTGWLHFKDDAPIVKPGGRIGVGLVDISGENMTVFEAKRLMYDWEYNLDVAIANLARHLEKFKKLDKDGKNIEVYCRPYDAMFAAYNSPKSDIIKAKDIRNDVLAEGVMSRFSHYGEKPFNTRSGFNESVYRDYAGLSTEELETLGVSSKADLIDQLMEFDYYNMDILKAKDMKVNDKDMWVVSREYLNGLSEENIKEVYTSHLKKLYDLINGNEVNWFIRNGKKIEQKFAEYYDSLLGTNFADGVEGTIEFEDKNGYRYKYSLCIKASKLYEAIKNRNAAIQNSGADWDNRLLNDVDPHQIYLEMFHDLRNYDQRGRMIRAFPGFQMFIIHEGTFTGKYKFWDNMYGYNAIESIDVYRSRKIAADTAVISMTNVYSNLTTRRTDVDFIDRQLKWWTNLVWKDMPQELIDKRENEIHKNINLQTGARIHLRMGYAANAATLPIVFNGTITEMDIGDVITVVAQGDGVELGNVISGDPNDDNDGLFKVREPRDVICKLLGSKGSWMKDVVNAVSNQRLMKVNPLGIEHFGIPWDTETSDGSKPLGYFLWYNDDFGEVAQNIYSSNGTPTYSQWLHPNGSKNKITEDFTWEQLSKNKFHFMNIGDEADIAIKLYNNTVWDVCQLITYCSPDYICAVHPFELRSTLFFGKPYWRCAFEYGSKYDFDAETKTWTRTLTNEARRPYMQHKVYMSHYDIIKNNIRASEDGLYPNVIVSYDGKSTPVLYADADIRYDKQKTRVIEADIIAKFPDFYTSEVMATFYGQSALRDNLKDMYQGSLLVMGDPSAKPHDMMYIGDQINDMTGTALIKAVTHHFSMETGFVTSIEPDLLVANDDQVILDTAKWMNSFASSLVVGSLAAYSSKRMVRDMASWIAKGSHLPGKIEKYIALRQMRRVVKRAGGATNEAKAVLDMLDDAIKQGDKLDMPKFQAQLSSKLDEVADALDKVPDLGSAKKASSKAMFKALAVSTKAALKVKGAAKWGKSILTIAKGIGSGTIIGWAVQLGFWIVGEMLFESYRRYRENLQSVIAIPLSYRGVELTAGINNHAGMIYGDAPGRIDKIFDATVFHDDGEDVEDTWYNFIIEIANLTSGTGGTYSDPAQAEALVETQNSNK